MQLYQEWVDMATNIPISYDAECNVLAIAKFLFNVAAGACAI